MIAVGVICGKRFALGTGTRLGQSMWCPCGRSPIDGCRAVVCDDRAGDQESLDALPLEERAAILLSIAASSGAEVYVAEAFAHVCCDDGRECNPRILDLAIGSLLSSPGETHVDRLAEAEARIRTGEVRP